MNIQADREMDIWTDRKIDRLTDRQAEGSERQTDRHTNI